MTEQTKSLGGFRIAPTADGLGNVVISDPRYEAATWCAAERRALAGPWLAGVALSSDRRVASLFAQHQDYLWANLPWQRDAANADLGVDSGQLGFFSATHYRYDGAVEPGHIFAADWLPLAHRKAGDAWYDLCCDLTTGSAQGGVLEYGCVSSSGYGDGSYRLQTQQREDGVIVGLRVDFIGDEEDEDEAEDYHDWNDEDDEDDEEEDRDADDDA
jgi:hypothetical protein